MIQINFPTAVIFITFLWILVRTMVNFRQKTFRWKRELQLLLVYICLIVVVRFTFFPFGKVAGRIQPLNFDPVQIVPFRINLVPFMNLFDYESRREAMLNFIGNITMFIPIGIIFPLVLHKLDTPVKVISVGAGLSLSIEILQLPFFDRVTDVDDLILNSMGYILGYSIYLLVKHTKKKA